MRKRYYIIIGIIIYICCLFSFENAYAISYSNDNIRYFNDKTVMKEELIRYIDNIDNYLIPNTSYNYSSILIENYDFLLNFSLNYIYNNKDKYYDYIKNNNYVDKNLIYKITTKYFNINYFFIEEENLKLKDSTKKFSLKINDVSYVKEDNYVKVKVIYQNEFICNYIFICDDKNYMYVYDIEVENS